VLLAPETTEPGGLAATERVEVVQVGHDAETLAGLVPPAVRELPALPLREVELDAGRDRAARLGLGHGRGAGRRRVGDDVHLLEHTGPAEPTARSRDLLRVERLARRERR